MKGRSGRPWRRLVQTARRELPPVCHLCGALIDLSLHRNDAMAWTLDHLTPLAEGGAPESLANLAPAHRRCNSRKGGRADYVPPTRKKGRPW